MHNETGFHRTFELRMCNYSEHIFTVDEYVTILAQLVLLSKKCKPIQI